MPRISFGRPSRLAALLGAAVLSLALAAGAAADTPPGPGRTPTATPTATPAAPDCTVLRVQLNGTQPATQTCLATAPPGQGTPEANRIGSGSCMVGDFELFSDSNFGGKRLCLWGSGIAYLNDYDFGWWRSWSNKTSSFKSGYYCGTLYDEEWGLYPYGAQYLFTYWQFFSSMPSSWTTPYWWNDRVSTVYIYQCVWG